jgi:hypothetical protein
VKRDFDLIRKILLYVEENHDGSVMYIRGLENYDNKVLMTHCEILINQKFLEGEVSRVDTGEGIYICKGITYEGYEFLDKIRNTTFWKKIKKYAKEHAIEISFNTINSIFTVITSFK